METSCPSLEALASYRDRAPGMPERESVETHAAACPTCRNQLVLLGVARGEAIRPILSWRWAAAAALLLAATAVWRMADRREVPGPAGEPVAPAASRGFPSGALGERAYLAAGADLVLEPGARVRAEGARRLRAEAGRFWAEVNAGEPLELALPGLTLTLRQGAVAVNLPGGPSTAWDWLVAPACAGEASVEIWVLRGEVEANGKRIPAPRKLVQGKEGWEEAPLSVADASDRLQARALAVAALPGREPSGAAAGAYRWVVVLGGRSSSTEAGLSFPVDGTWHKWVVGLGALAPADREVIEVAWDGTWLTGRVNGVPSLLADRRALETFVRRAPGAGWQVSVWGGEAKVVSSRLQEVP